MSDCYDDAYTLLKGDTGAAGAKGEKGDTGTTGANGTKGDTGDKGDTGASAIKYIKPILDIVAAGSPTPTFISAVEHSTWISPNLIDSVDGTVATKVDFSYKIYRYDGAFYYDSQVEGTVTQITIDPSTGAMSGTLSDVGGTIPSAYTDQYRVVVTV